jgi:hypothetical protein
MKHKTGDNGPERWLEKRLLFVESREDRMHQTHAVQAQRESEQDDMHGGDYSTRAESGCVLTSAQWMQLFTLA